MSRIALILIYLTILGSLFLLIKCEREAWDPAFSDHGKREFHLNSMGWKEPIVFNDSSAPIYISYFCPKSDHDSISINIKVYNPSPLIIVSDTIHHSVPYSENGIDTVLIENSSFTKRSILSDSATLHSQTTLTVATKNRRIDTNIHILLDVDTLPVKSDFESHTLPYSPVELYFTVEVNGQIYSSSNRITVKDYAKIELLDPDKSPIIGQHCAVELCDGSSFDVISDSLGVIMLDTINPGELFIHCK